MPAAHVGHLHTHVSSQARGEIRKGALYDGIEGMVGDSIRVGIAAGNKEAAMHGVPAPVAKAIIDAALADFVETHAEFEKAETRTHFVALDLGH